VAYLRAVIEDVKKHYNVDPTKVFVTGYSNGAFMAHLFACEAADLVAAISVFAGTMISGEETFCVPSSPVAVMHTHGNNDQTIDYNGGTIDFGLGPVNYLSAFLVVSHWVQMDGCNSSPTSGGTFDVDASITSPPDETSISIYGGCQKSENVELWTVDQGTHTPTLTVGYANAVVDYLYNHPKT
jgi:polyhydroxybutyrate depolymerase